MPLPKSLQKRLLPLFYIREKQVPERRKTMLDTTVVNVRADLSLGYLVPRPKL